jgi:membrane protein YdbS with pleckstrin-like domain
MSAEESVTPETSTSPTSLPAPTQIADHTSEDGSRPRAREGLAPTSSVDRTAGKAAEEVDVWWGAYSPRTMAPSFVLCLALTVGISAEAWSLGIWQERSPARYTAQALMVVLWLMQLTRWVYRITALNYRLTNRRLFRDQGFYRPQNREVELTRITHVVVERGPLERVLRLGRLRILVQGAELPPIVLEGVYDPNHVAMDIRKRIQKARELNP